MKPIMDLKKENLETIILPCKSHGNYDYPDLFVSTELFTTCDIWNGTVEQMKEKGVFMLTLRQFVDYVNLLRSKKVFYGKTEKQIPEEKIRQIYDETVNNRKNHYGEVFDGQFMMKNSFSKEIQMKYSQIYHGKLEEGIITLDDHLGKVFESRLKRAWRRKFKDNFLEDLEEVQNKRRIDIKYWLENATNQGLPPPNNPIDFENGLPYLPPRPGGVINFGDYGGLHCRINPNECRAEYSSIGGGKLKVVRPAWVRNILFY